MDRLMHVYALIYIGWCFCHFEMVFGSLATIRWFVGEIWRELNSMA